MFPLRPPRRLPHKLLRALATDDEHSPHALCLDAALGDELLDAAAAHTDDVSRLASADEVHWMHSPVKYTARKSPKSRMKRSPRRSPFAT